MKNNFEKTGVIRILLAIPHFRAERESVRKQVSVIVAKYVPQIQSGLKDYVDLWRKADEKYYAIGRSGRFAIAREEFEKAEKKETAAWNNAHRLSAEMMEKISTIPHFDRYFSISNPAKMSESFFEFGPCTKRAVSYCDNLIKVFGS